LMALSSRSTVTSLESLGRLGAVEVSIPRILYYFPHERHRVRVLYASPRRAFTSTQRSRPVTNITVSPLKRPPATPESGTLSVATPWACSKRAKACSVRSHLRRGAQPPMMAWYPLKRSLFLPPIDRANVQTVAAVGQVPRNRPCAFPGPHGLLNASCPLFMRVCTFARPIRPPRAG
jgi:hypothetical protein